MGALSITCGSRAILSFRSESKCKQDIVNRVLFDHVYVVFVV